MKWSERFVVCSLALVVLCFFAVPGAGAADLLVSAALSLKAPFEEVGKAYEKKNPGTRVVFNFGASGDLLNQIAGGAPVDVFASAALKDMDEADRQGLIISTSRADIASNSIVLIVSADADTQLKSYEGLISEPVRKIAVGNPRTVPAGRYAEEVLHYYKLLPAIKGKLVLAENVRQVLDYVARGEVDAGIVYTTDAATRPKEAKIVAVAPEASHSPVRYPIAVVKASRVPETAKQFIATVTSREGQTILRKYGFVPVTGK